MSEPPPLTKQETFALEEFRALRREIDGQEAVQDRILRRAVFIIAVCYLLIVFRTLPFSDEAILIPPRIVPFLEIAPIVVVGVSWLEYGLRYAHLKRLACYIENLEAVYYGRDDKTLGWERWLRNDEQGNPLRKHRHHMMWGALMVVALLVYGTFDPAAFAPGTP